MSDSAPRPEPASRYNRTAMLMHWVVAAFVIVNIFVGLAGANNGSETAARRLIELHKSLGFTIFGLVVLRLLWRFAHKPPALPSAYSRFDRIAAHSAHALLYAVMLLLPLTGYIHDSAWKLASTHPIMIYGLVHFPRIGFIQALNPVVREHVHDIFGDAHVYVGYLLYGLLGLHLLGVAKHHVVDHEKEIQRMLPETYRRTSGRK